VDKQALAVMIPVLAVFFGGLVVLSQSLIGKAIARRIEGSGGVSEDELSFLREQALQVDDLRDRLAELEERVDFAERLLPRAEPASDLPGRG